MREVLAGWVAVVAVAPGSGREPEPAPPPRAVAPDATAAQRLRWVLRFQVTSGKEYVEQLAAVGGQVLVPVPPKGEKLILVEDLKKPGGRREATDKDLERLRGHMRFTDARREVAESVAEALGLDFKPAAFQACFPKAFEDELARKEQAYRNRRVEDIERTVFRVAFEDGKCVITVVEQTVQDGRP
ncbi:MAG: hypothetical protein C0501_21185 [Isosphaera sp.]|nr:hypothetical protein [Isosphaera sp.]